MCIYKTLRLMASAYLTTAIVGFAIAVCVVRETDVVSFALSGLPCLRDFVVGYELQRAEGRLALLEATTTDARRARERIYQRLCDRQTTRQQLLERVQDSHATLLEIRSRLADKSGDSIAISSPRYDRHQLICDELEYVARCEALERQVVALDRSIESLTNAWFVSTRYVRELDVLIASRTAQLDQRTALRDSLQIEEKARGMTVDTTVDELFSNIDQMQGANVRALTCPDLSRFTESDSDLPTIDKIRTSTGKGARK